MRKLFLLTFASLVALCLEAQNIKVMKFERLEKDMTANTHGTQKLDQNGEKAALIKIQAPERGFTFNGGSLGIVASEEHDGEIWLYVPRRAKKLTIQHKDYGVLREYYYPVPVEGARTYEMYIDIGTDSRDDALSVIGIGDSVCFDSEFCETESTIRSKAIDDRFGCLVLIELIKSDLKYDTDFAFVVQEEVGLRGAKVAAYSIDPEFALVIETTTAADIPEIEPTKQVCTLGEGAVVSVMDRTTIYDKGLVKAAFETAEQIGVKAQYKRAVAGGNDAGIIHKSNGGIRTLAISLACRYLHAPNCVANKSDCGSVMLLAHKMAEKIAGGEL